MREIKFRLWSKTSQQIISWDQIVEGNKHHVIWYDDYPAMQFTGLCDKNGKEIYEGDIISSRKYMHEANGEKVIKAVYFDAGTFRNGSVNLSILIPYFEPEIIGNIHENPELLK